MGRLRSATRSSIRFPRPVSSSKQQSQNIFIFSAYTDACTSSCKIVVASKALNFFSFSSKKDAIVS